MDLNYSVINFHDKLKLKYKDYLKEAIVSISMIQSEDNVYLETSEIEIVEGEFEKHVIKRVNLNFISDNDNDLDDYYFNPEDKIESNVMKFINEFTPYSIINTTDIFNDEACEKISRKYNTFNVDM